MSLKKQIVTLNPFFWSHLNSSVLPGEFSTPALQPHNNTGAGTLHEEVPLFTVKNAHLTYPLPFSLSAPRQAGLECDGLSAHTLCPLIQMVTKPSIHTLFSL